MVLLLNCICILCYEGIGFQGSGLVKFNPNEGMFFMQIFAIQYFAKVVFRKSICSLQKGLDSRDEMNFWFVILLFNLDLILFSEMGMGNDSLGLIGKGGKNNSRTA